ncbi:unnamed protein product [Schistosoma turkestanicum]|nr:unnamed protein product [Schistosoma turkestanicum]
MRTTVGSDCWSGSMVNANMTTIPNNETKILQNSQSNHQSSSLSTQSSSGCSTKSQAPQEYPVSYLSVGHVNEETDEPKSNREKSIRFSGVTVYSFARQQGFSSIPDDGWCTLGMAQKHFSVSQLDLHQHRILQRLRRKQRKLLSQKSRFIPEMSGRGRGKSKIKGRGRRANGLCSRSPGDSCRVPILSSPPPLSPQIGPEKFHIIDPTDSAIPGSYATPPPPCLSPPSPRRFLHTLDESFLNNNICNSLDSMDTDSEASLDQIPSINSSERTHNNTQEKLMPIHSAARIKLLRSSGVREIDESERLVCTFIRAMRSRVGCNCGPKNSCIPGQCSCADDGIPCQVDRASFPCSCTVNDCCNPNGRNEFSHEQVRAHTQHVLARFANDCSIQPVHSTLDMSTTLFSTPNGACRLCLERSKTTNAPSNSSLMFFSNNNNDNHSKSVEQLNSTLDNPFLSISSTDLPYTNNYNILSPVDRTEDNWSHLSPCSNSLKKHCLMSDHSTDSNSQVLQTSFMPSVSLPASPIVIELTFSPDAKSRTISPKPPTSGWHRFANDKQTPLRKQSSSRNVSFTECASSDDDCIIMNHIPEACKSSSVNEIPNTNSLADVSIIHNINDVSRDSVPHSQMVTKIIQRRRSRSADITESRNCDEFSIDINNNHTKNVDNILTPILPLDSDMIESSSNVRQLSQVPDAFEYVKSTACWPVTNTTTTTLRSVDNKNCFISKSAPNSPCLQKNDFPFGRISLRRRAIPRTPILTLSRRKALGKSNLLSTPSNKPNSPQAGENLSTSVPQSSSDDNADTSNNNSNNNNTITETHAQPSSSSCSS